MFKVIHVVTSIFFGIIAIYFLDCMIQEIYRFFSAPSLECLAYASLAGAGALIIIVAIWEGTKMAFRR